jgi:Tol biopolymer transport system component
VFAIVAGSRLPVQAQPAVQSETVPAEDMFLDNVRQITFQGRRAGEGYFGCFQSNGENTPTEMVFQSERRPDNPFFQIYTLNFQTGETASVSPGVGKTTCAWLHPNGNGVLFASTQFDPQAKQKQRDELAFRESGQTRRYSWDYDPNYELVVLDRATKSFRRLTDAKGYDAEGSYSPDGKLIAFASNRNAFTDPLSEADQKLFQTDPSFMMDIFIMNSDGSNVRQLTNTPGYDGGPFFSPDGKRICWRRFSKDGLLAEIYTMNIDGSDVQQLTKMNVMSWAPFYHPSGDYIVFTTNKHGFNNFELYIVDADPNAVSSPVRVTSTDGFDGLASFTPDGNQLTWTSNRNAKKQSQIFLADWNHLAAKSALEITADRSTSERFTETDADGVAGKNETQAEIETDSDTDTASAVGIAAAKMGSSDFESADIVRHVDYLCRKELGGRMTGSPGERKATAYVAAYLSHLGCQPEINDRYFQAFDFPKGAQILPGNKLSWKHWIGVEDGAADDAADGADATANGSSQTVAATEFRPLTFSANISVKNAGVVFAGYGIVAPQTEAFEAYDSYVHLDVKDKWVLVFRFVPQDITPEHRQHLKFYSGLRKKLFHARQKGAAGLIVVSGPTSQVRQQLVPLRNDFAPTGSSIAAISVTDDVAAAWFQATGKDMQSLQKKLDSGQPMIGFNLKGLQVSGNVAIRQMTGRGRNVVARLQWSDLPTDEVIVVGAHIDHLGKGSPSSLATEDQQQQIHVGADDNASGVAAMLEIAEYCAQLKSNSKSNEDAARYKRDIVFAAWSGEELGLHGSKHFVDSVVMTDEQANNQSDNAKDGTSQKRDSDPVDLRQAHDFVIGLLPEEKYALNGQPISIKSLQQNLAVVAKMSDTFAIVIEVPTASDQSPSKDVRTASDRTTSKANEKIRSLQTMIAAAGLKRPARVRAVKPNLENSSPVAASSAVPVELSKRNRSGGLDVVAAINMDMVGRLEDKLILQGIGSSDVWPKVIERKNVVVGLPVALSEDTDLPTDATSFYQSGVPILSAFTGSHQDYHTPRDTPEKLNYPDAARIAKLMGLVVLDLVTAQDKPNFIRRQTSPKQAVRGGVRAYLGTVPSYGDDVVGVKLSGTTAGAPADIAGVKGGDIIVGLAGQNIENIYDYTAAIDGVKIGQETTIVVIREQKRLELKITPKSRQ